MMSTAQKSAIKQAAIDGLNVLKTQLGQSEADTSSFLAAVEPIVEEALNSDSPAIAAAAVAQLGDAALVEAGIQFENFSEQAKQAVAMVITATARGALAAVLVA